MAVAEAVVNVTGHRFVAEMVRGYGLTHVFFVPTILTPALAAMGELGITRVSTHGEKAAAYMADGYARAARKPALCMAQTVGAANLAAGLKDAWLAGSPVLAISGGSSPNTRYRHAYQELRRFLDLLRGDQIQRPGRDGGPLARPAAAGVSRGDHRCSRSSLPRDWRRTGLRRR